MYDPYPSRNAIGPERIPRVDPVVFGGVPGPLTDRELEAFEADGYLVLDHCLPQGETSSALEEANQAATRGTVPVLHERDSLALRSVFRVHEDSGPSLVAICDEPKLVGAARQILGSEVYIHQSRVDFRTLEGREFYWQSDYELWHVEDGMPRMRAVTACVLLTPSTCDNGPLLVIPGSHNTFVPCVDLAQLHGQRGTRRCESAAVPRTALSWLVDDGGVKTIVGAPGTVVLMDCNLMHAIPGSLSPHRNASLFVAFNSVENTLVAPFDLHRDPRPSYMAQRDQPRDPLASDR